MEKQKEIITLLGRSGKVWSELLGVSTNSYSAWRRGQHRMKKRYLIKVKIEIERVLSLVEEAIDEAR